MAVHRNPVAAGRNLYEPGGLTTRLDLGKPPGKTSALTAPARHARQQRLAAPTGFATYGELRDYLARGHQVQFTDFSKTF